MAKRITGENPEFELVAPVKILVKPGLYGDGITPSSLRRRSISTLNEVTSGTQSHHSGGDHENDNIFLVSHHLKQLEKRERQKDVSIEIQDDERKNVAYYLQHCFRLMYFTGMSTYNPDKKNDVEQERFLDKFLIGLQKGIFWTIAFLSLAIAILFAKTNCVVFLAKTGVLRFVYVGSWLFAIVSDIYFIYLFAYRHKQLKAAIETLNDLGNYTIEEVGVKKWKCYNPGKLITVLFAVTVLACFIQPMGGYGVSGWTPKKLILDSSNKLSYQLFLWSPDDFDENSTKIEDLDQKYSKEMTRVTVIMGISEIWMQFCHNMKMDTAQNIGVVIAVLIWLRNRYFGKKIRNTDFKNDTNGNDSEELDLPDGLFAEFKQLRKENRIMNGLTGGLLKIVHANNLLQSAKFLMRCLAGDASLTQLAFLLYDLVKVAVIYFFAKKAEAENDVYEEWIREWSLRSSDPIFQAKIPAILDGMTKAPLGVGRGNFLVAHGFIFRFIGFVGSIFMLEVDNEDED